jgi:fructokinase
MIVVAGESLIDLISTDPGQLIAHCGGGPFNTAQALARLGQRVSFLGSISDDALGLRLRTRLVEEGVGVDTLVATPLPTTLALAEIDETGSAHYRFYTEATAEPALTAPQALAALPAAYDALYVGGLGLALEPIGDAIAGLVQAADDAGALVMVDPNSGHRRSPHARPILPDSSACCGVRTWSKSASRTSPGWNRIARRPTPRGRCSTLVRGWCY